MKAIQTKYLPATNTKGSRIRAFDSDGNSVTVSHYHDASRDDAHRRAARALCEKMDWRGRLIGGHIKDGMAFVWDEDRAALVAALKYLHNASNSATPSSPALAQARQRAREVLRQVPQCP